MERVLKQHLLAWKQRASRKPLLLYGPRQVGKTWLIRTFGEAHFDRLAYFNLERDRELSEIFRDDFRVERILRQLSILRGESIEPQKTLLVLDEIQAVPHALTALKYFAEDTPDLHVIAAGSLLGVATDRSSFPVGKVEFLDLAPMSFSEFLSAMGESLLADALINSDWTSLQPFHLKLLELLRLYFFVGGMPEAVKTFVATEDLHQVRAIQSDLIKGYEADFGKHAPAGMVPAIGEIWRSLPNQLAKENRKFKYADIKSGARARTHESAINWLVKSGLVHRVFRYKKPAHPVSSYEDNSHFKLYLHDIGLLGALSGLDSKVVVDKTGIFTEFKGALTEQYVLQELVAISGQTPHYWRPDNSQAEVDFTFTAHNRFIPVEVKAGDNLKAKSLQSFVSRYGVMQAVRTSIAPYYEQDWLTNVPLYGFGAYVMNTLAKDSVA